MKYLKSIKEMVRSRSQFDNEKHPATPHYVDLRKEKLKRIEDKEKEEEKETVQEPPNPLMQSHLANHNINRFFSVKDYKEHPVMTLDQYILHLKKKNECHRWL